MQANICLTGRKKRSYFAPSGFFSAVVSLFCEKILFFCQPYVSIFFDGLFVHDESPLLLLDLVGMHEGQRVRCCPHPRISPVSKVFFSGS